MTSPWKFWIDRGGTFTDCVGVHPVSNEWRIAKVLSSDLAPIEGIRQLLDLSKGEEIPPCEIRMGTTVATNALLERKGAPSSLIISRGFGDALEIGHQARPELFALEIEKPELLYNQVIEVDARHRPDGSVLAEPDWKALEGVLVELNRSGTRSAAIVVLHAYAATGLEERIGELAKACGIVHVSLSHEVNPEMGLVSRGETSMVDAYLTPLIRDYVSVLSRHLPGSELRLMQSGGGLVRASSFRGVNSILSGPAGGVVACARICQASAIEHAICFDMGGTSTDVSRFDGTIERQYDAEVAGVRLRAPMVALHTVAAGGGSLCTFQDYRLQVGPESAGSDPGPLCYGGAAAHELSLTDINLFLGRVLEDRFPFPLHASLVDERLSALVEEMAECSLSLSKEQVAQGFFELAIEHMAEAIRHISVAQGYDVRDYTLFVFGGAGGQHACSLARRLGIVQIASPPHSGVLSAIGMGLSDVSIHKEADAGRRLLSAEAIVHLEKLFVPLKASAVQALASEGFLRQEMQFVYQLDLRYQGTETSLTCSFDRDAGALRKDFMKSHQRLFGYVRETHPIEVVSARLEALGPTREKPCWLPRGRTSRSLEPIRLASLCFEHEWLHKVPVFAREHFNVGDRVVGPAFVVEETGTTVIEPGFVARMDAFGMLLVERSIDAARTISSERVVEKPDPVRLEVFNNLFMSVAEEMGAILRRTAMSTNIRERLDFSCALFDRSGALIANAPHIPVHLGAMGESVRAILADVASLLEGDVYVTNDPARGGSHLPDITVVSPVYCGGRLAFFVASRGHHADVGGLTPGSMPPFSSRLEEEGVVFRAVRVVRSGQFDEPSVRAVLSGGEYPCRNPEQNIADLQAQIAANKGGEERLKEMVQSHGLGVVERYMSFVQDNAARLVEDVIEQLADGEYPFEDALDDGAKICVIAVVTGRRLAIDFSGTAEQTFNNLNAPRAVTVAAVLYVLRCLVGKKIPLNAGCLRPVSLEIEKGSILDPDPCCAVAGGNVETSQRVVDVLLGALGKAAASQGTMNNFTFGDGALAYYETIAGGAGATHRSPGASCVQTHMTNTRITDPEVLEARFPVRIKEFSRRRGSGGSGRNRGGDGVVREVEVMRKMVVSMISERRSLAPFGLAGGGAGKPGRNSLNGKELPGKFSIAVEAGDCLKIETPGGGGYGAEMPLPASKV